MADLDDEAPRLEDIARAIATIEDSLKIADEGKKKRAEAEKELVHLEDSLKSSLQQASARAQGLAPPAPAPAKP